MLIGIIMYISLFKSEIGSKLRPKSMFQSPLFAYRYGHSFILFVIGCISAEIVGTLNFFLFIQIREIGREKVSFIRKNADFSFFLLVHICHLPYTHISQWFEWKIGRWWIFAIIRLWFNRINHLFGLRQFHVSCIRPHQKRKQMKSEQIRLEWNLKRRHLLNVKSIHRYRMHFFHRLHSVGRCSIS